jgi:hypothetical protein
MDQSQAPLTPEEKMPNEPLPTSANSPILRRPIILGDLTLGSPTTQTTIGANGAATALTANPVGYITVLIGNVAYQLPYYNVA